MPTDITEQMKNFDENPKALQSRKGSEAYWLQSARNLGLFDLSGNDKGICFRSDVLKAKQKEATGTNDVDYIDEDSSLKNQARSDRAPSGGNCPSSSSCDAIDMLSMLAAVAQSTAKKIDSPSSTKRYEITNVDARNSSLPSFRKRKLSVTSLKNSAAKQA
mmetsp:Transcript_28215/g.81608  ORF Transcript_28215/g.81608 Transcript_28215/m.81608 type:complete len:161 (-) Transcript_28215:85-567(-)